MLTLTDKELLRYDRQITLQGFDIDKQEILKNSKVLIIGLGGLGCPVALYLAAAGIGSLTFIDFDTVSLSNLSRQILYSDSSIGQLKALEAKVAILQYHPEIMINTITTKLNDQLLMAQISDHDIVLDCTDNLATREQINRCCYQSKKALISGAAIRMEGLLTVLTYHSEEPCYQCLSQLFGQQQLSCVEAGVMAPLVGIIGSMQALEAIKMLTHYGNPLISRLLMVDAMTMQFNELSFTKQPHCPVCGHHQ